MFYDHCEVLIDVLQRVADETLRRVIITMPPRHGKSETASRLFPSYYLYRNPDHWVGLNSYAATLAYTLSRNARSNFIRAGGQMNPKSTGVSHWETMMGGGMWAAGVGGSITGKGFQLGIIDDPLKNQEWAASEVIREKQKDWYKSTFATREEPNGAIILILTRWHDDDLAGWLLDLESDEDEDHENWHIVSMPAIYTGVHPAYPATCTVEPDGRSIGDPLCEERYPLEKLERLRTRVDEFWEPLYQQNPSPPEGEIFKTEWWDMEAGRNRYSINDVGFRNSTIARWLFYDTAMKDEEKHDYSACVVMELKSDYRVAVANVWQDKIQSANLPKTIEDMAVEYNLDEKLYGVVIEDRQSGTTAIQTLRNTAPEWLRPLITEFSPTGSKEYRARQASIWCNRNMVMFPYPHERLQWYFDFIDDAKGQLYRFPNAKNDDMVDAFTMGVIYLENFMTQGWMARIGNIEGSDQS